MDSQFRRQVRSPTVCRQEIIPPKAGTAFQVDGRIPYSLRTAVYRALEQRD